MTMLFTRRRQVAPPVPVVAYRNASASIGVFETGSNWTLSVGRAGAGEATFQFSNRDAAENAAAWLSFKDLSGLVQPGMSWVALVDAISDRRPAAATTGPVTPVMAPVAAPAVEEPAAPTEPEPQPDDDTAETVGEQRLRDLPDVGLRELRGELLSAAARSRDADTTRRIAESIEAVNVETKRRGAIRFSGKRCRT